MHSKTKQNKKEERKRRHTTYRLESLLDLLSCKYDIPLQYKVVKYDDMCQKHMSKNDNVELPRNVAKRFV